jgi:hypothetical protein
MRLDSFHWVTGLGFSIALGAIIGACGGSPSSDFATHMDAGGGTDSGHTVVPILRVDSGPGSGSSDAGDGGSAPIVPNGPLTITQVNQTLNVTIGSAAPTLQYAAFVGGTPVSASWSIDRGELGTLNIATGGFTAGETVGGTAHVTASYGSETTTTTVTVSLHLIENGGPAVADGGAEGGEGGTDGGVEAGSNAGGNGGVGGNGPGGPVSAALQAELQGSATADSTIGWLYPYNNTVWPQGILAPLLQWNAGAYNFDAVYIHIYEAAFDFKGFYTNTATPFINTPVSEAAWTAMAYSNGGEPVTVSLVFDSGGTAIGPITETWNIALGTLEGTVYYNSYGTQLATNYCCDLEGNRFGGATLAVKGGSTNPVLIAGSNSECRVCHSVAAGGSMLVTQQGSNYPTSSSYNLQTLEQTTMTPTGDGTFAWPAIYPDGTFLFSNSSPISGGTLAPSGLYTVPGGATSDGGTGGTVIPATGLIPDGGTGIGAACPAFSPDGTHVAFNFYGGTGADRVSLAWMDFAQPTSAFSGLFTLYTPPSGGGTAVWPSFLPTNNAVLFELETVYNGRDFAGTRSTCDSSGPCSNTGTEGELWWVDQTTKTPTRLDQANGLNYLPTGPNDHMADWELNYEPTVNPVPSGGYAWVVFTSRRLYGNIATINPYWSDPRFHDISQTPTTKKLWVAAIDLNAAPGTDPSHPAFYLPGQELLAGNSRGYWVVNPCLANGTSCLTGDQCCGGYCEGGDGGALTCGSIPSGCSTEYEKCSTASDCCGSGSGIQCIDSICSEPAPPIPPPPPPAPQ